MGLAEFDRTAPSNNLGKESWPIARVDGDVKAQGRRLADGEVQPACVQTCPPSALVFGDLNDLNSQVSQLARSHRAFRLLDELGTDPAVIYLKGGETNVPG